MDVSIYNYHIYIICYVFMHKNLRNLSEEAKGALTMKCPSCAKPLNILQTIKASIWAEYRCASCNRRSKRPKGNQLLSLLVLLVIPFIHSEFRGAGLFLSGLLTLSIALIILFLLTLAFGRLELIDGVSNEG